MYILKDQLCCSKRDFKDQTSIVEGREYLTVPLTTIYPSNYIIQILTKTYLTQLSRLRLNINVANTHDHPTHPSIYNEAES